MKKSLILLILSLLASFSFAQVLMNEYSWTYTAGTYTEITGGTLLGSTSSDDQRFVDPAVVAGGTTATGVGFPIGFSFTYGGVVYDRLAINNNGWISLGQSALTPAVNINSTSNYTPLSSTTAISPAQLTARIAALGMDLQGQTGSELRIETIGTDPNLETVIQWKNFREYGSTGQSYNFQIRLQQNGNKVVFCYGTMTNGATAFTAHVGLRNEPATPASNFKSISSTTSWSAPTAGATASATMTLSATVYPASGTTYTWAPPVAGMPPNAASLVSPTNAATQVIPTSSLNWTSGGGSPTGYRLYMGTTNPPTLVGDLGLVTTYTPATALPMNTLYYWQVIPYNANGDAASCPVWSFTTHNGQVALTTPADAATGVNERNVSFSWGTAPSATGYMLQVGTSSGASDVYYASATSPTTVAGPLAYNTTYYWSVFSVYPDGRIMYQSPERTFTTRPDPTVSSFPWTIDFGTTGASFPPANWTKHSGVLADPTVLGTNPSGSWISDDWKNTATTPVNYAATINIWSTVNGWLITPPIAVPADDYEVKFDLALMAYGNNNPPATTGTDDVFAVLVGDGTSWTPANVVRQWDNAGSADVYNNIPPAGVNISLPLGTAGTKYVAFYGISTTSNADNHLQIDNVTVRQTPAAPMLSVNPTSWDFGQKVINTTATKQFTIANNGGGTLDISNIEVIGDYFSITSNPAPISLGAGISTTLTVQYAPTMVGEHSGTITITDGRAITVIELTGECYDPTVNSFPYSQNFETWPPFGWDLTGGTHTFVPYIDAIPNTWARANYWSQTAGSTDIMTTPPLHPTVNSQFSFTWSHSYNSSYPLDGLKVQISSDGTNWTDLWSKAGTEFNSADGAGSTTPGTGVAANVIIPASYTNTTFWIRFYGNSGYGPDVFIDNVMIDNAPAGAPEAVTLNSPANGATGLSKLGFNLSWTPSASGGIPTTYGIWMSMDEENIYGDLYFETTATSFNPVTDGSLVFNFEDRYYWTIEAINEDGSAVVEPPYWFEIEAAPPVINTFPYTVDFEAHSDNTLPAGWIRSTLGTGALAGWRVGSSLGSTYWAVPAHTVYAATNDDASNTDSSMDILTSPVIDLSGAYEGVPILSFDSYYTGAYSQLASVEVSTDNGANWTPIHNLTAFAGWTTLSVNLVDFDGMNNILIRFHGDDSGEWSSGWAIDNIGINFLNIDMIAPVITHFPLINTANPGDYVVTADIVDDLTWNSGISSATLYYSTDATNYSSVPMVLQAGNTYSANIPHQALGTDISYYIVAVDNSSELNTANTVVYPFSTEYPTWLGYTDTNTTALGFGTAGTVFGVMTRFENPYGTDPMQLTAVVSGLSQVGTADFYVLDDELNTVFSAAGVSFTGGVLQSFSLANANIVIDSPEYYIMWHNIVGPNYFYLDQARNQFPGTHWIVYDDFSMTDLNTTNFAGSWLLQVQVQRPMNAAVTLNEGQPMLSWNNVPEFPNYNVYAADSPYSETWTNIAQNLANPNYQLTGADSFKFYKVTCGTIAARNTESDASLAPRNRFRTSQAPLRTSASQRLMLRK